jgi:LmbE family N-acetylglucosaminyl deacetylase
MKVLLLSPHPDDFIFFMGGTFLSHLKKGDSVVCVLATRGEKGNLFSWIPQVKKRLSLRRMKEAKEGLESFANLTWVDLGYKEGSIDFDSQVEPSLASQIASLELTHGPFDVVYLPEYKRELSLYGHKDHRLFSEAALPSFQKGEGNPTQLRFYHSKKEDYRQDVGELEMEVEGFIRNHRSQFSIFAYPPLLLHFGLFLRRRYLNRTQIPSEGFREIS